MLVSRSVFWHNEAMEDVLEQLFVLRRRCEHLENENNLLHEALRCLRARTFGPSASVLPDAAQLLLFPEAQPPESQAPEQVEDEPESDNSSTSRKKSGRKKLNPELETVDVVVDIPEEDKVCSCGCLKSRIGEETSQKLEYVPARGRIIQTIRPKYACKACEGVGAEGPTVSIAPPPPALIGKSIVTPSLMTHVLLSKIVDSIPLYRQEMQLERLGVSLSRGSMANWMITLAEKCKPLLNMLIEMAKKRPAINLDETTIQVMNEKGRKNTSISYMWLLRAGPPLIPRKEKEAEIVVYQYHPTREASFAKDLTSGFRGFVQTDDYAGYRFLHGKDAEKQGWVHVHCLAHARRLFVEAAKACHGQKRQKTLGLSAQLVQDIAKIYKAERKAKEQAQAEAELIRLRQEMVVPLLTALRLWSAAATSGAAAMGVPLVPA